jgi:hypothetical protein
MFGTTAPNPSIPCKRPIINDLQEIIQPLTSTSLHLSPAKDTTLPELCNFGDCFIRRHLCVFERKSPVFSDGWVTSRTARPEAQPRFNSRSIIRSSLRQGNTGYPVTSGDIPVPAAERKNTLAVVSLLAISYGNDTSPRRTPTKSVQMLHNIRWQNCEEPYAPSAGLGCAGRLFSAPDQCGIRMREISDHGQRCGYQRI